MQYKMKLILGKLESTQEIKLFDEEEEKKLDETDYVLDYNKPRVIRKRIDAIKEIIMSSQEQNFFSMPNEAPA